MKAATLLQLIFILNMKKKKFLLGLMFVLSVFICSCGGEQKDEKEQEKTSSPDIAEQAIVDEKEYSEEPSDQKTDCKIISFSYTVGDKIWKNIYNYKINGALYSIETSDVGNEQKQVTNFEYNKRDKLLSYSVNQSKAFYNYHIDGRLLNIDADGNIPSLEFEYNGKDQIITQKTVYSGKVYSSKTYEYSPAGVPVAVKVFNQMGKIVEEYEIKYDNKVNPFVEKGAIANPFEQLFGYPVGNYKHNVIGYTKIFHEKTSFQIKGEYKKPGDKLKAELQFEYNEYDYPISIKENEQKEPYLLEYECE